MFLFFYRGREGSVAHLGLKETEYVVRKCNFVSLFPWCSRVDLSKVLMMIIDYEFEYLLLFPRVLKAPLAQEEIVDSR